MEGPLFSKVLIANRGEIAVRIIRTCREVGIATVAVYSTADRDALHVAAADEAFCIGPAPALESYLNADAILAAARQSGAQAIHPGYGFLAENAIFARAVIDAGIVWVGPPAEVIAKMGDKVVAKHLARSAGVPVVPGYDGACQDVEQMAVEADRIGYPIMLKAAAGGGGKGMRTVAGPDEFPSAFESARREARSAFGSESVFLEKLIVKPRHVEIQIVVDAHGNGVYLGERDCSIQRRHQKVVEEAPSPILTSEFRAAMGEAAIRFARAGGYVNAGTVEFLFSNDEFFFLEMNTRIQVEHPVTESITGLDLIRLQLEIASGRKLALSQLDVELRGHAIEVRLYAEDPSNGFVPMSGRIEVFEPPAGAGVRNDAGIDEGSQITQYYDPMLAKLIVHAETRRHAVRRMRRALEEYVVLGLTTNLGFLHWIVKHPDFEHGRASITWLDETWKPDQFQRPPREVLVAAAIFETLSKPTRRRATEDPFSPWVQHSSWRHAGLATTVIYRCGDENIQVQLSRQGESEWIVQLDAEEERILVLQTGRNRVGLMVGAQVHQFSAWCSFDVIWVGHAGNVYTITRADGSPSVRARTGHGAGQAGAITPMPGTVIKVAVAEGQLVAAHEPLMILEAMKMEHVVEAPHAGVVKAIHYRLGDLVPAGASVVDLEEQ